METTVSGKVSVSLFQHSAGFTACHRLSTIQQAWRPLTGVANDGEMWTSIYEPGVATLNCRIDSVVRPDRVHVEGQLWVRAEHCTVYSCL